MRSVHIIHIPVPVEPEAAPAKSGKVAEGQSQRIELLPYAVDLPNVCSLVGLCCALLGIYWAVLGNFPAAMISVLWAVLFDSFDGIIARRMKRRTDRFRAFGGQLDSLIDIVSFAVCPAVILLSYGEFSPWFLPGAFVILSTGALRLSYYNVYGLEGTSTYRGLPLDNNILALAAVFLLDPFVSRGAFIVILHMTLMALAALNVAPIRVPKVVGRGLYVLGGYIVVMTAIYGFILASHFS